MQTIDISPTPARIKAARRNIAARAWRRRASRMYLSAATQRTHAVLSARVWVERCAAQLAEQSPRLASLYLAALSTKGGAA